MDTYHLFVITSPSDMTEGRGPNVPRYDWGLFTTEQKAWDFVNDRYGICGAHPKNWSHVEANTWQEYEAEKGWSHYKVKPADIKIDPERGT